MGFWIDAAILTICSLICLFIGYKLGYSHAQHELCERVDVVFDESVCEFDDLAKD